MNSKLVAQSRDIVLLKQLSSTSTSAASGSSEPSPRTVVKDEDTTSADENVDGNMVGTFCKNDVQTQVIYVQIASYILA